MSDTPALSPPALPPDSSRRAATQPRRRRRPTDDRERLPWERRPGETSKAYAAFQRYCKLGGERSLVAVALHLGKSGRLIRKWSADWDWVARSRDYDTHMADVEAVEQEKIRAEYARRWERRRMESADANWDRAQRLAVRAEEMLKTPLYEQRVDEWMTDSNGVRHPVAVTLEPAKWTLATAGALLKLAAELQAAAIGEATGSQDDGFDPMTATEQECREYLARAAGPAVVKALPAPQGSEEKGGE